MEYQPPAVTLRQWQYLVAIAERGSFRGAAKACRVAQPSLSMQVALAEQALGIRMFERDRRKVLLTREGALLLERARALVLSAEALVTAARMLGDPLQGTVRLGVLPTIAPYRLPDIAAVLRKKFAKLHVEWSEEKTPAIAEGLHLGTLDGAIVALEAELGATEHVSLGFDEFVFACAKEHSLGTSVEPLRASALEGERVLLLEDGHCFRSQAWSVCAKVGAEEHGYRATSLTTLVQMVAGGEGVTLLPRMAVDAETRKSGLRVRRFAGKVPGRTLALVWRKGSAWGPTFRPVASALKELFAAE